MATHEELHREVERLKEELDTAKSRWMMDLGRAIESVSWHWAGEDLTECILDDLEAAITLRWPASPCGSTEHPCGSTEQVKAAAEAAAAGATAEAAVETDRVIKRLREQADLVCTREQHGPEREKLERMLAVAYRNEAGDRLQYLATLIGEWRRRKQFRTDWHNVPEKLLLTISELCEAMEAYRHLTGNEIEQLEVGIPRSCLEINWAVLENFEEELADAAIRLLDLCEALRVNLARAICQKMAKNEMRPVKHGKER